MIRKVKSIAFIIDGNRRWAKKNKMNKTDGHSYGLETLKKTISWVKDKKIKHITFYIFSTENWGRKKNEVNLLMKLFEKTFKDNLKEITDENVAVKFVGNLELFSEKLQKIMKEAEEKTKNNKTIVYLATSYGGRAEIINAIKKIPQEDVEELNEKKFEEFLWTKDIPEPEIIIRTGGNRRLSNFLLWKSAYSEIYFLKTLWPDFSKKILQKVLEDYYLNVKINKGK